MAGGEKQSSFLLRWLELLDVPFLELCEDSDRFRFLFLRFLWSEEEADSSDEESQEEEEEVDFFLLFFNLQVLINHEVLLVTIKIQHYLAKLYIIITVAKELLTLIQL